MVIELGVRALCSLDLSMAALRSQFSLGRDGGGVLHILGGATQDQGSLVSFLDSSSAWGPGIG